jgi:hypothetical protein
LAYKGGRKRITRLILIIIWLFALSAGGAYYGHRRWGYGGGAGIGIGNSLLILLAVNVLGVYH